jgi:hypothetical protein
MQRRKAHLAACRLSRRATAASNLRKVTFQAQLDFPDLLIPSPFLPPLVIKANGTCADPPSLTLPTPGTCFSDRDIGRIAFDRDLSRALICRGFKKKPPNIFIFFPLSPFLISFN